MKTYETMARRNWPRTYTGKILLVSFLGVHVPMFGAVAYVLLGDTTPFLQQLDVLGAMLVATLIGTAGTMYAMHALLAPVHLATKAADGYLRDRKTPRLPTRYTDSAGVLMASVQECITRLDSALTATELQRTRIEQEHASKFKMLAGMRHDFRTPLTHILGLSELMKAEAMGPLGGDSYKRHVTTIGKSGQDLLRTLNSVLDLSDAESRHQMEEDSVEFDLAELAHQGVSLEHLHAQKRGVDVDLRAGEEVPVYTVPDVAKNLLSSALQAMIEGAPSGGSVHFAVAPTPAGACVIGTCTGGRLCLEDVPVEMQHFFDDLESSTGSTSVSPETSTPMTLRLTLLDTLSRTVGAAFRIAQHADGWEIRVDFAQAPAAPLAVAVAAE